MRSFLANRCTSLHVRFIGLNAVTVSSNARNTTERKLLKVIAKARSLRPEEGQKPDLEKIKQAVRDVISKYQALSEETKEELKATFPHTAKIITSKFSAMHSFTND